MQYFDLTLPSPEENLALDEALLDLCELNRGGEVLRFWEPTQYFVVVGYANTVRSEVDTDYCRRHQLPILRRCTGGGTVLQGPGVLDYSLVLRQDRANALQTIPGTNDYVLARHADLFTALLGKPVSKEGHTDLALGGVKFSGNAQRRRKDSLLFHGSFLLNLDLSLIEAALTMPSRQPPYRQGRSHRDFLTNLGLSSNRVKERLAETWHAVEPAPEFPFEEVSALMRNKYSRPEWNLKF